MHKFCESEEHLKQNLNHSPFDASPLGRVESCSGLVTVASLPLKRFSLFAAADKKRLIMTSKQKLLQKSTF